MWRSPSHGTMDDTVPFCDGERSRDHWLSDNGCSDEVLPSGLKSYRNASLMS
jgi:hypothetical protein